MINKDKVVYGASRHNHVRKVDSKNDGQANYLLDLWFDSQDNLRYSSLEV